MTRRPATMASWKFLCILSGPAEDLIHSLPSEVFDEEKLRTYEKQRLRYYFAIVTTDSVKTAKALYNECEGMEIERSSNVFDLRFVPDDTTFEQTPR